jgi:PAS domain S-box-containing protein
MQLESILDRKDVPADVREAIQSFLIKQKQAKETQQELGVQIRQTFDSMGDAIHVVDADLRFILFNTAFKQWNIKLGLKDDVIGLRITEVFPFLSEKIIDEYQQVFDSGEPLVTEEHTRIREEDIITETRKIPIFDEGKVTRIVTVVKNITDYRQTMSMLKESEEQYRNLIERANDGIALIQDSLIKYVNPEVEKLTGYSPEELYNTPITNYIHPKFLSEVFDRYEQRIAGQSVPEIYETKLLLKNNRTLEVEVNASVITYQGKPADLAIIRDISERKQVEQALRESEEKYRTILETIEEGYYEVDLRGNITLFNDAMVQIHGYPKEEFMGMNNREYTDEQTAKMVYQTFNRVYQTGEPARIFEYEIIRKDGTRRVGEASVSLITNSVGEASGFRGIVRDITERKQAGDALRESKEKYQMLVEKLQEGVLLEDSKGIISFVNPRTAELLGYTEDELLGKHWSYIVPKEFVDQVKVETIKRRTGVGSTYEASLLTKDEKQIPVIITATPIFSTIGEFTGVLTVFTDITELKQGEKKLRESVNNYSTILETIEEGYYEVDLTGSFTFFNDSICNFLGYSKYELVGMNYRHYMDEETAKIVYQTYNTVYRTGEPTKIFDFGVIRKNGSWRVSEASVSPIHNSEGEIVGFRGIVRDVTDRIEMEKALGEERVKYQMLIDQLEEGLTVEDTEGFITYANPKALETLGYTEEELLGKHWSFIVPENDHVEAYKETAKRAKGISSTYESHLLAKDGTISPVIVSASPIMSTSGEFQETLVLSTDITEQKRVEEELQQSEEKYSNLFHYSNDAIFLHDLDGNILDVNEKTLKLFGFTKPEILSMKIPVLHPPEMLEASRGAFERIVKDGFISLEIDFIKKNGEMFPADVSSSLFTIGGKQVIQGIVRDIAERKEKEEALEESEKKFRLLAEKSPNMIFINKKGRIVFANEECVKKMGYSKDELYSPDFDYLILIAPEYREMITQFFYRHLSGEEISPTEYELLTKTGSRIQALYTSKLIDYGGEMATLGIITDITKLKQAEAALHQVKLEEERYHAMMSHFINNDMQKIINNVELLSIMYKSRLEIDSNIVNKVIDIASGSSKTIDTVNQIFEVLQSPFFQPEDSLELIDVFNEVISEQPSHSHQINIDLKNLNVSIFADTHLKDIINEILVFIFSFYSDSETTETSVDIKGSFLPSSFCVLISDNCSEPLSQEIITKLSEKITDEWEIVGHNIGIALASVIMQYYGGSLNIQSVDPKGNTFQLLFPLNLITAPARLE